MHRYTGIFAGFTGGEEALCWTAGLAFTFTLFFGLAHIETISPSPVAPEIEDLRVVSLPLDSPPPLPRTEETRPPPEDVPAFAGLETGASDSPVRIAVVPPDLEALMPVTHELPRTIAPFGFRYTDLKPRMDAEVDPRRVYQPTEVDERPKAMVRVAPRLWAAAYGWGPSLSTTLLIGIGTEGQVENVRLVRSCGHPEVDAVIAETVMDKWLFSPAIKRGRKVRCLVEQKITLVTQGRNASPFDVHN